MGKTWLILVDTKSFKSSSLYHLAQVIPILLQSVHVFLTTLPSLHQQTPAGQRHYVA